MLEVPFQKPLKTWISVAEISSIGYLDPLCNAPAIVYSLRHPKYRTKNNRNQKALVKHAQTTQGSVPIAIGVQKTTQTWMISGICLVSGLRTRLWLWECAPIPGPTPRVPRALARGSEEARRAAPPRLSRLWRWLCSLGCPIFPCEYVYTYLYMFIYIYVIRDSGFGARMRVRMHE